MTTDKKWKNGPNNKMNTIQNNLYPLQWLEKVHRPLPKTQYRPIACATEALVKPQEIPLRRCFKKVRKKQIKISILTKNLRPFCKHTERRFQRLLKKLYAKVRTTKHNPVGNLRRKTLRTRPHFCRYYGNCSLFELGKERQLKMLENLDMHRNSRKPSIINKILSVHLTSVLLKFLAVNKDATQLLLNGKTRSRTMRAKLNGNHEQENFCIRVSFLPEEPPPT